LPQRSTAWTPAPRRSHHSPVRVLAHIKKLDDCFGDFLVRVTCKCGAVREITGGPGAPGRLVSDPRWPRPRDSPKPVRVGSGISSGAGGFAFVIS
jgi:hypothetical protein